MNIFVTSKCPIESASYLDTIRLNKMISESAQLLCSALRHYEIAVPYKKSHQNHPAAVWCRATRSNYMWLWNHFDALWAEMFRRRGTIHKSGTHKQFLFDAAIHIPDGELTPFVNCAANAKLGISYKHIEDTCLAYQLYLSDRWETDKREPTWE